MDDGSEQTMQEVNYTLMHTGLFTRTRTTHPSCGGYSDTKEAKAKGFYECKETPHLHPNHPKAEIEFAHPDDVFWNMNRSENFNLVKNKAGIVAGNVLMIPVRILGHVGDGIAYAD